jgi:serine/threonine protein phosphatase PrpC
MGGYPGIYTGPGEYECPLQKGDIIFLASDGVTLHVSPEEIRDAFLDKTPREAAQYIKQLVYERGAFDNFSFVVVVWE